MRAAPTSGQGQSLPFLVPKLCLGTPGPEALLRRTDNRPRTSVSAGSPSREAELRGLAFPSRAWERGEARLKLPPRTPAAPAAPPSSPCCAPRPLLFCAPRGYPPPDHPPPPPACGPADHAAPSPPDDRPTLASCRGCVPAPCGSIDSPSATARPVPAVPLTAALVPS